MKNHAFKKLVVATLAVGGIGLVGCDQRPRVEERHEDLAKREAKFDRDVSDIRHDEAKDKADAARRADDKIAQEQRDLEQDRARVRENDREDLSKRRVDVVDENHVATRDETVVTPDDRVVARRETVVRDTRAAALPAGSVTGTLVRGPLAALTHDLKVRDNLGHDVVLKTDDRTRVLQNGREVQINDYREGTEVRASFATGKDRDDRIARDVIIVHPVR